MFINYHGITVKKLKYSNINLKYLNWFRDKEVKRFIVNFKYNKLSDLKKYFKEIKKNKNIIFLGIFMPKNNHIGNVKIEFFNNKKNCIIGILIGEKKYRSQGIGSIVLDNIINKLNSSYGTRVFRLGVNKNNSVAINSYKNSGFKIKKKIKKNFIMESKIESINFSKFCIGTAQLGMNYGIVNSKKKSISQEKFKSIVKLCEKKHIQALDTSPLYGNAEEKTANQKLKNWKIISKFPPANMINEKKNKNFYKKFLFNTLKKLKIKKIYALLIHRPKDLETEKRYIFKALDEIRKANKVKKIGLSLNSSDDFQLVKKYNFDLLQAPINIFDQKVLKKENIDYLINNNIELHARSIFLQGLTLLKVSKLPKKFKKYKKYWFRRDNFLRNNNISSLGLSVNFILNFPIIKKIIVGIDEIKQLKEIVNLKRKKIKNYNSLKINNKFITAPYLWNKTQ